MDECTASVDVSAAVLFSKQTAWVWLTDDWYVQVRTDEKIQEMIRDVFQHCTVFAIAHSTTQIFDTPC